MIQALYIFRVDSRKLLYSKSFQSEDNLDMFSEFFSALQTFSSEMTSSDTLNTVGLGNYSVLVSRVNEINSDIVMVIDKNDVKEIQKLIPKITKIILNHEKLFTDWDHDGRTLLAFDEEINKLILTNTKLILNSNLAADQKIVLKSIWEQKGSLSEQLRDRMLRKEFVLKKKLESETIYLKRFRLLKRLIRVSERLQNDEDFIKYQKELQSLKHQIKDQKIRLKYYLDRVREAINRQDHAQVYSFMYSFCVKLEHFIDPYVMKQYKDLTQSLLDPKEYEKTVKKISALKEKMSVYVSLL